MSEQISLKEIDGMLDNQQVDNQADSNVTEETPKETVTFSLADIDAMLDEGEKKPDFAAAKKASDALNGTGSAAKQPTAKTEQKNVEQQEQTQAKKTPDGEFDYERGEQQTYQDPRSGKDVATQTRWGKGVVEVEAPYASAVEDYDTGTTHAITPSGQSISQTSTDSRGQIAVDSETTGTYLGSDNMRAIVGWNFPGSSYSRLNLIPQGGIDWVKRNPNAYKEQLAELQGKSVQDAVGMYNKLAKGMDDLARVNPDSDTMARLYAIQEYVHAKDLGYKDNTDMRKDGQRYIYYNSYNGSPEIKALMDSGQRFRVDDYLTKAKIAVQSHPLKSVVDIQGAIGELFTPQDKALAWVTAMDNWKRGEASSIEKEYQRLLAEPLKQLHDEIVDRAADPSTAEYVFRSMGFGNDIVNAVLWAGRKLTGTSDKQGTLDLLREGNQKAQLDKFADNTFLNGAAGGLTMVANWAPAFASGFTTNAVMKGLGMSSGTMARIAGSSMLGKITRGAAFGSVNLPLFTYYDTVFDVFQNPQSGLGDVVSSFFNEETVRHALAEAPTGAVLSPMAVLGEAFGRAVFKGNKYAAATTGFLGESLAFAGSSSIKKWMEVNERRKKGEDVSFSMKDVWDCTFESVGTLLAMKAGHWGMNGLQGRANTMKNAKGEKVDTEQRKSGADQFGNQGMTEVSAFLYNPRQYAKEHGITDSTDMRSTALGKEWESFLSRYQKGEVKDVDANSVATAMWLIDGKAMLKPISYSTELSADGKTVFSYDSMGNLIEERSFKNREKAEKWQEELRYDAEKYDMAKLEAEAAQRENEMAMQRTLDTMFDEVADQIPSTLANGEPDPNFNVNTRTEIYNIVANTKSALFILNNVEDLPADVAEQYRRMVTVGTPFMERYDQLMAANRESLRNRENEGMVRDEVMKIINKKPSERTAEEHQFMEAYRNSLREKFNETPYVGTAIIDGVEVYVKNDPSQNDKVYYQSADGSVKVVPSGDAVDFRAINPSVDPVREQLESLALQNREAIEAAKNEAQTKAEAEAQANQQEIEKKKKNAPVIDVQQPEQPVQTEQKAETPEPPKEEKQTGSNEVDSFIEKFGNIRIQPYGELNTTINYKSPIDALRLAKQVTSWFKKANNTEELHELIRGNNERSMDVNQWTELYRFFEMYKRGEITDADVERLIIPKDFAEQLQQGKKDGSETESPSTETLQFKPGENGVTDKPFHSYTLKSGKKVDWYVQTTEKDGVKVTRVVSAVGDKEVRVPAARFPFPEGYEIDKDYLPEGKVVGVKELRETADGAAATIIVEDEQGLTDYEVKLNKVEEQPKEMSAEEHRKVVDEEQKWLDEHQEADPTEREQHRQRKWASERALGLRDENNNIVEQAPEQPKVEQKTEQTPTPTPEQPKEPETKSPTAQTERKTEELAPATEETPDMEITNEDLMKTTTLTEEDLADPEAGPLKRAARRKAEEQRDAAIAYSRGEIKDKPENFDYWKDRLGLEEPKAENAMKPVEDAQPQKRKRGGFFKMGEKKEQEPTQSPSVQDKFEEEKKKFEAEAERNKRNEYASVLAASNSVEEAIAEWRNRAARAREEAEDWRNRKYKSNNSVVTGVNRYSSADEYETTIGAANERRRRSAIRALEEAAKEYEGFIETLKSRTGYKEESTKKSETMSPSTETAQGNGQGELAFGEETPEQREAREKQERVDKAASLRSRHAQLSEEIKQKQLEYRFMNDRKKQYQARKELEKLYDEIEGVEQQLKDTGEPMQVKRFERPAKKERTQHAARKAYDEMKKKYANDDEVMEILNNTDPQDIYEEIGVALGSSKLLFKSKGEGAGRKRGVAEETGWKWNDVKGMFQLFDNEKGQSVQNWAETFWADLDEGAKNKYSSTDIANMMLDVLSGASTIGDLRNIVLANRVRQAEELLEHREKEEEYWRDMERHEQEMKDAEEEAMLEHIKDLAENFDEQEYNSKFADEILKEQRDDSTGSNRDLPQGERSGSGNDGRNGEAGERETAGNRDNKDNTSVERPTGEVRADSQEDGRESRGLGSQRVSQERAGLSAKEREIVNRVNAGINEAIDDLDAEIRDLEKKGDDDAAEAARLERDMLENSREDMIDDALAEYDDLQGIKRGTRAEQQAAERREKSIADRKAKRMRELLEKLRDPNTSDVRRRAVVRQLADLGVDASGFLEGRNEKEQNAYKSFESFVQDSGITESVDDATKEKLQKIADRVLSSGSEKEVDEEYGFTTESRRIKTNLYASEKSLLSPFGNTVTWVDTKQQCVYSINYTPNPYRGGKGALLVKKEYLNSDNIETPVEGSKENKEREEPSTGKRRIDDFGEKIGGARKDLARNRIRDAKKMTVKDLTTLKKGADDILSQSNIMRLYKGGQMDEATARGFQSLNSVAKMTMKKLSPTLRDIALKKYRDAAVAWEEGKPVTFDVTEEDVKAYMAAQPKATEERAREVLDSFIAEPLTMFQQTYEALNYPAVERKLGQYVIVDYTKMTGRRYVPGRPFWVKNGYRASRGYPFATLADAVKKLETLCPEVKEKDKKGKGEKSEHGLHVKEDGYGFYIKSRNIPGNIYLSPKFYTEKQAKAYLEENLERLKEREQKLVDALMGSNIGMAEREGVDYRNGKDVVPQDFLDEFGFRGVEFGNWVPQGERQMYLNKTYDAIKDFCAIVGISPKAFSLGGRLGLAFGARGKGRAMAHYEPAKEVINLTRMSGVGSLAHEWFHAVDNYLAKQKTGNMSDMATVTHDVVREELGAVFNELYKAMKAMDYHVRSSRAGEYWGRTEEEFARLFENYIYEKLAEKEAVSPVLVRKDVLLDDVEEGVKNSWPYPSAEENARMKPYFEKLFDTIQEKTDENGNVVLYQRENGWQVKLTPEEAALRDGLVDVMRQSGIDVVVDDAEGQRVLDEVNGADRVKAQKGIENLAKAANTIKEWLSNDVRGKSFTIELPEATRKKIRAVMGHDFDSHNITINGIVHGLKEHGVDGKKLTEKSIPIRKEDAELIPYIMTKPDYVRKGSTKNGRESVRFYKTLSNGYVVVVEKEFDNSADDLETINIWGELSDVSNAQRTLNRTPETPTIGMSDVAKIKKDAEEAIKIDAKNVNAHRIADDTKLFKTSNGEVYGFVKDGKMYLDPRVASSETAVHEYSHLWSEALRKKNPQAWEQLKNELLKDKETVDVVKKLYPELDGDDLMDEVFSNFSGKRGAEKLRTEQERLMNEAKDESEKSRIAKVFDRIKRALDKYWNMARDLMAGKTKGIEKLSAEDFADMALNDLLRGEKPDAEGKQMRENRATRYEEMARKAINGGKNEVSERMQTYQSKDGEIKFESARQLSLFGNEKAGSLFDDLDNNKKSATIDFDPKKMSDEELLTEIGGDENSLNSRLSSEEYDRRHLGEYNQAYDAITSQLEENRTSKEQADEMLCDIVRKWRDGHATGERTPLKAQFDALNDYYAEKEAEEQTRRDEIEDAFSDAIDRTQSPEQTKAIIKLFNEFDRDEISGDEALRRLEELESATVSPTTPTEQTRTEQTEQVAPKAQAENPKVEKKAKNDPTAIKMRKLVNGEVCHVERKYIESKQFDFTGREVIKDSNDIAYLFRQLENSAIENVFLVLLDKNNRPTILHVGMGGYNLSLGNIGAGILAASAIKPKRVILVHNHPSGVLKPSSQDVDLLKKTRSMFGNNVVADGIIIDITSGKYCEFGDSSYHSEMRPERIDNEIPHKVYSFSKSVFDKDWNPETAFQVRNSDDVAKYVSSHRLGEHDKYSLLVLDNQHHVTANVFLPWTDLNNVDMKKTADEVSKYVHQMGGLGAVLYGNGKIPGNVNELRKALKDRFVDLLDFVTVDEGSAANRRLLREPGSEYLETDNIPKSTTASEDVLGYETVSRNTEQRNREYAEAVEKGNTKKAEQMVKAAAKAAGMATDESGKPIDLYHGTNSFGFTMFDRLKSGIGAFFTSTRRNVAANYAGDNHYAGVRKINKGYKQDDSQEGILNNARSVFDQDWNIATEEQKTSIVAKVEADARRIADEIDKRKVDTTNLPADEELDIFNATAWVEDLFYTVAFAKENGNEGAELYRLVSDGVERYNENKQIVRDYYNKHYDELDAKQRSYLNYLTHWESGDVAIDIECSYKNILSGKELATVDGNTLITLDRLKEITDESHNIGSYHLYGNLGDNPLIVDAEGKNWYSLEYDGREFDTDTLAQYAKENGYTALVVKNVYDYGDKADDYIFFDPTQIKSADPVTYDDAGNVIPLSERFNTEKQDIRYRLGEDKKPTFYSNAERAVEGEGHMERVAEGVERANRQLGGNAKVVREADLGKDVPKNAQAWYDPNTGEVHVVAERVNGAEDAARAVWHEEIGHKAMSELLGDRYNEWLDDVHKLLGSEHADAMQRLREKYAKELEGKSEEAQNRLLADEWIAELAERGEKDLSTWQKVKGMFRNWLWKHFGVMLGDGDIDYMLHKALAERRKGYRSKAMMSIAERRRAEEGNAMAEQSRRYRLLDEENRAEAKTRARDLLEAERDELNDKKTQMEDALNRALTVRRGDPSAENLAMSPKQRRELAASIERLEKRIDALNDSLAETDLTDPERVVNRAWDHVGLATEAEMLMQKAESLMKTKDIMQSLRDNMSSDKKAAYDDLANKKSELLVRAGVSRYSDLTDEQKNEYNSYSGQQKSIISSLVNDMTPEQRKEYDRYLWNGKIADARLTAMRDARPERPFEGSIDDNLGREPQYDDFRHPDLDRDDLSERDRDYLERQANDDYSRAKAEWNRQKERLIEQLDDYEAECDDWRMRQRDYMREIVDAEKKLRADWQTDYWSAMENNQEADALLHVADMTGIPLTSKHDVQTYLRELRYEHVRRQQHAEGEDYKFIKEIESMVDKAVGTGSLANKARKHGDRKQVMRDLIDMMEGTKEVTEEMKPIVKKIQQWFDDMFEWQVASGLVYAPWKYRQGYVPHLWNIDASRPDADAAAKIEKAGGLVPTRMNSPFMNERFYDTYEEGIQHGLVPKHKSIIDLIKEYSKEVNKAVSNRQALDILRFVKAPIETEVWVEQEGGGKEKVKQTQWLPIVIDAGEVPPKGVQYNAYKNSAFYKDGTPQFLILSPRYVKGTERNIYSMFGEQGYVSSKDAADSNLEKALGTADKLGQTVKQTNLMFSAFHGIALTEHMLGSSRNPLRVIKQALYDTIIESVVTGKTLRMRKGDVAEDAMSHFVKLGNSYDFDKSMDVLTKLSDKINNPDNPEWRKFVNAKNDRERAKAAKALIRGTFGTPFKLLKLLKKGNDFILWDMLHDGYKLSVWDLRSRKLREKAKKKGWSEAELNRRLDDLGQTINDMFGGQHWELLNASPRAMRNLRLAFLSPDWNASWLRLWGRMAGMGKLRNDNFFRGLKKEEGKLQIPISGKAIKKAWKENNAQGLAFTVMLVSGIMAHIGYSLMNLAMRKKDIEEELAKAEEIRKTDPNYKSPYEEEGITPITWENFLGRANEWILSPWNSLSDPGRGTYVYVGRDANGVSRYIRPGKQMRELFELFLDSEDHLDLGAWYKAGMRKANPFAQLIHEAGTGYSLTGWENKELTQTYGGERELNRLKYIILHSVLPMSIVDPIEKGDAEKMGWRMAYPVSKGMTWYRGNKLLEEAIANDDSEMVERIRRSFVLNGMGEDFEKAYSSSLSKVRRNAAKAEDYENKTPDELFKMAAKSNDPKMRKKYVDKATEKLESTEEKEGKTAREAMEEYQQKAQKEGNYLLHCTAQDMEYDTHMKIFMKKAEEDGSVVATFRKMGGTIPKKTQVKKGKKVVDSRIEWKGKDGYTNADCEKFYKEHEDELIAYYRMNMFREGYNARIKEMKDLKGKEADAKMEEIRKYRDEWMQYASEYLDTTTWKVKKHKK